MSVTFSVAFDENDTVEYAVGCYAYGSDNDFRCPVWAPTREAALARHAAEHAGHPDCDGEWPSSRTVHDRYDVNLSNANAAMVLDLLGYPTDDEYVGSEDADLFLGRVLTAVALTPADAGRPATESVAPSGARFVDCGRPAGYTDDTLARLRTLANYAGGIGRKVTWA